MSPPGTSLVKTRPPNSNIKPKRDKNKYLAAFLAYMLGGFGIHRFYLGDNGIGILYLIFCWTLIPLVISFFEIFYFLFMDDAAFDARYNPQKRLQATVPIAALPPGSMIVDGVLMVPETQPHHQNYSQNYPSSNYSSPSHPTYPYTPATDATPGYRPGGRRYEGSGYEGAGMGVDGSVGAPAQASYHSSPDGTVGEGSYHQPPSMADIRAELEHLNELRLQGLITDDEFLEQKRRIWASLR